VSTWGRAAKLDRAEQHLYALGHGLRSFAERTPYRLVEQFELGPGEEIGSYRYVVAELADPPAVFACTSARSCTTCTPRSTTRLGRRGASLAADTVPRLPQGRDVERDRRADHQEHPEKYVALMEQAQPYHAKNPAGHLLAILNHLWNGDKHRLLATTLPRSTRRPSFTATRDVAAIHDVHVHIGPLRNGRSSPASRSSPTGLSPR